MDERLEELRKIVLSYPKPKTEVDLYQFLYLISQGENIPHKRVCKDHNSVWDFVTAVFFNKYKNILAIGNRKGGKTRTVAKLIVAEMVFNPYIEIASVGAIEKQANKCFRYVNSFLNYALPSMIEKDIRSETRLANGASYEQLVGTVSGVNCLSGDTLIKTEHGYKPISDLVGKKINLYGYNIQNHTFVLTKAEKIFKSGEYQPIFNAVFSIGNTYETVKATLKHPFLSDRYKYIELKDLKIGDKILTSTGKYAIVEEISYAGMEDVFDITVPETSNFVANGIVVHNSPHPHKLRADEVELMKNEILEELLLIPTSDKLKGIPSNTLLTSTRKYQNGLVQSILDSKDKDFRTFIWCYKEVAEKCPIERRGSEKKIFIIKDHLSMDSAGKTPEIEVEAYSNCGGCPLLPTCRGDLARAEGYMPIEDLISDFKKVDIMTWAYQMECRRLSGTYKVYPQFDEAVHTIPDLDYNPNLPLDISIDFGYTDPTAVLFLQYDEDKDIVYVIDEVYESGLTTEQIHYRIIKKLNQYNLKQVDVRFQIGDSAQAQQIADLNGSYGYAFEPIQKTLIVSGLDKVRSYFMSLAYGVRLYISRKNCPFLIKELKNYRFKKLSTGMSEHPLDKYNHACDSLRYYIQFLDSQKIPEFKILG